jgi:cytidylate kinase
LACSSEKISEKEAAKKIHKQDESLVLWVENLFRIRDPWAAELYDIVIPMNKVAQEEAAKTICDISKARFSPFQMFPCGLSPILPWLPK